MSRKAYSEEERDLIRSRLMDVAAALFKEKGIRDTNIDEIYTPVGISKTFFYSFFPSKAVLAIAIMKEGMGGIGDLFRRNVWEYGAENGITETFSEVISTMSVLTTRMTEGRRMLLTFAETADETSSLQIKSLVALVLENRVI